MRKCILQILVALDQLLNTLIYIPGDGFGWADETLSARAFRCFVQDIIGDGLYKAIDIVFFWQTAHCNAGWRAEWDRNQFPNHYRNK